MHYSKDGRRIVGGSVGFTAWSTSTGEILENFRDGETTTSARITPNGGRIVTGTANGIIKVWRPPKRRNNASGHTALGCSRNGRMIAVQEGDKTVRVLDGHTGDPVGTVLEHDYTPESAAVSNDGTRILTNRQKDHRGSADAPPGQYVLWDAEEGTPMLRGNMPDFIQLRHVMPLFSNSDHCFPPESGDGLQLLNLKDGERGARFAARRSGGATARHV